MKIEVVRQVGYPSRFDEGSADVKGDEHKMNLFAKKSDEKLRNLLRVLLIVFLTTTITYIVFMTGGTKGAWPQLYYIIIILAAYIGKLKVVY